MSLINSGLRGLITHTASVTADDKAVALKVKALASAGYSDPGVQVAGTTISLYKDASADTLDDTVLTAGELDLDSADTTVSELVALINASTGPTWAATQVAGLPSDVTASSGLKLVAIDEDADEGLACVNENGTRLYWDTTAVLKVSACMGLEDFDAGGGKFGDFVYRRSFSNKTDNSFDITDTTPFKIHSRNIVAYINGITVANTTSEGSELDFIKVWAVDKNDNEREIFSQVGPGSNATLSLTENQIGLIQGLPGERLVCVYGLVSGSTFTVPTLTIIGGLAERA